jgi:ABC-type spermidine/putrescine transport system permease subunit I
LPVSSVPTEAASFCRGAISPRRRHTAGDVVNPLFLGGPNERMIANTVENLLLVQLQAPRAAALTLVLMALVSLAVWLQLRDGGVDQLTLP